jgi:hypothetical protein
LTAIGFVYANRLIWKQLFNEGVLWDIRNLPTLSMAGLVINELADLHLDKCPRQTEDTREYLVIEKGKTTIFGQLGV